MSYVALYRKWRPDNFGDVKGQEHIVTTLKNQVKFSRIGHAYLFCGTRGTGKTTLAKIMAKAANCEHPVDGSPCNECESCRRIASGQATNVVEIDAASNNGVDNIRQIQNAVTYRPSDSKYLVYIIDEVHMLSSGAFNALLKTLEEPPEYVIFILATTEAHKIPATISSRCQHFDFKRIPREYISDRLAELLEKESVKSTKEALDYIAGAADGSMRDALSILDQCIAFNLGEELTYDRVLDTIGTVDIDIYIKLFKAIYEEDVKTALEVVDEVTYDGKDLTQFANEFIMFLRNLLMLKLDPELRVELTTENITRLIEFGKDKDENYLIDCINSMQEAATKINAAYVKKVMLELAIIKLCKPQMQQGYGAIEKRLANLESQGDNLEEKIASTLSNMPVSGYAVGSSEDGTSPEKKISDRELQERVTKNIEDNFPPARVSEMRLVAATKNALENHIPRMFQAMWKASILRETSVHGRMDLEIPENRMYESLSAPDIIKKLEGVVSDYAGREIKLNVRKKTQGPNGEDSDFWDLSKLNTDGLKIEINR